MPRSTLARQIEAQVLQKTLRDIANRLRFGPGAPKSDEVIFMDPNSEIFSFKRGAKRPRRNESGRVADGDWDTKTAPFHDQHIKYLAIEKRYGEGLEWKDTGLFEHLLVMIERHGQADGCRTLADIQKRYDEMDRMVDAVAKKGRFDRREDRPEAFRREHGGILMHIDRHGRGIRSGGGMHRFAIARILKLKEIPLQVGMVHRGAVLSGAYEKLRQSEIY